jgi:hypothetical protein
MAGEAMSVLGWTHRSASHRLAAVCCVGSLVALATAARAGLEEVDESPVELTLQVELRNPTGARAVALGETLASGAQLRFRARVDRPAHLYVLHRDPRGGLEKLYPKSGDPLLPAAVETLIPGAHRWFRLDERPGEEHLFFVVSPRPLSDPAATVREVPASAAPRPQTVGIGNRGTEGAEVVLREGETAVYHFWVRHERTPRPP